MLLFSASPPHGSAGFWKRRFSSEEEAEVTTIDQIAEARRMYRESARSKRDWFTYINTVERLRREREGVKPTQNEAWFGHETR